MTKIDDLFNIFDEEMIPIPSGILLHGAKSDEITEIIDRFSNYYSEYCGEFIATLVENAKNDFEYGILPDKTISYEIIGTDIKIIFNGSGFNLFSIDYGRNLPSPDEFDEFDSVINKTIQNLTQTYRNLKYEGLFAWNYNNGIDYVNYGIEVCNCDTNGYAVELLTAALEEEGIEDWDEE